MQSIHILHYHYCSLGLICRTDQPYYPVFSNGQVLLVVVKGFLSDNGTLTPQSMVLDFAWIYSKCELGHASMHQFAEAWLLVLCLICTT